MLNAIFNKKDFTLQECETVESDKKEKIRLASERIVALREENESLLPSVSEGEPISKSKFQKNKLEITEHEDEISAHTAFLEKILPAQKNRARAIEIEALIPEIEKLDARFSSFIADINKKVAALVEANNSFRKFLGEFEAFGPTNYLGLRSEFVSFGLGGIQRNSPSTAGVYSDPKEIDITIILMAAVYDKDKFNAWVEITRSSIARQIALMRDHARRLKGDEVQKQNSPYCPNCYKFCQQPEKNGKAQCQHCNKVVEPVW